LKTGFKNKKALITAVQTDTKKTQPETCAIR